MKLHRDLASFGLRLLVLAALASIGNAPVPAAGQTHPADTWSVRGTMTDACQCKVFCPCELAEKPTFGHCNDTAILNVEEGHLGSVDLSGERIVVVSKSPEGERLVDTVGELVFAHMYVPEGATDEQAEALAELARRVFGVWSPGQPARISPHETVEKVPMQAVIEPTRYRVEIPGILSLDVEAVTGGDGKTPVVVKNGPAAGPGVPDIVVARSNRYRYTDHGIDWDYAGRSATIRPVEASGPMRLPAAEGEAATSGR
jgi:hypothetical protein